MSKYTFRDVRKLEKQIEKTVAQYRNSNTNIPLSKTEIPDLFERMLKLDEPTWEKLVIKNRDIAQ